jgi:hypothetical protein
MAIAIPSDLIADVLNAAAPERVKSATARLSRPMLATQNVGFDGRLQALRMPAIAAGDAASEPSPAYRKFEAFLLGSAFEDILPPPESGVFGNGFAADIWRSKFAERIAEGVSERGGIGIAKLLDGKGGAVDFGTGALATVRHWPYFEASNIRAYRL